MTAFAIARDLSIAVTVGGLVAVMTLMRGKAAARALLVARIGAIAWVISAGVFVVVSYSDIALTPLTATEFGPQLWTFVDQIDLGRAYGLHLLAALITSIAVTFARTPNEAAWSLAPVAWGIGLQAMTGHAAGATDHHLATTAMFMHLVASAVWLGVLVVLAAARGPLGADAKAAITRGSRLLLWAAVLMTASGTANAWLRLERPGDLFASAYGRLLLLKLVLMAVAVALAAWHRKVTMPRLSVRAVQERFWRVLSVDVALIAAVAGIGGVLSRQAPPREAEAVIDPSPAFLLTGYALPPRPDFLAWLTQWRLEILSAFVLVSLLVVYLRWVRRLHRRGDTWKWYRTVSFVVGIALLWWITQGAPAVYGMVTFSGHMVEHMLLVMVVPLPIVMAAPITLALRALPGRSDGTKGPREWLRSIVESRFLRFMARPAVAAVNFAGSMVIFYYSPIFEFALRNHAGHLWMVVHFTLAGYLFANALVGIDPGPTRPSYPMRLVLLFATMAFHAFFGVSLTDSEVLLAPTWFGLMGRDWGADAISDQQWGGAFAWGLGEFPVVILAIAVLLTWKRADGKAARRRDARVDAHGDAELAHYNEMLARLKEGDDAASQGR